MTSTVYGHMTMDMGMLNIAINCKGMLINLSSRLRNVVIISMVGNAWINKKFLFSRSVGTIPLTPHTQKINKIKFCKRKSEKKLLIVWNIIDKC